VGQNGWFKCPLLFLVTGLAVSRWQWRKEEAQGWQAVNQ